MKNKVYFLKEASVLLIVVVMVLSTMSVTGKIMNNDNIEAEQNMFNEHNNYAPTSTDQQITDSIAKGIDWLARQQDLTGTPSTNGHYGSWGGNTNYDNHCTALTAFALIKLQYHAYETAGSNNLWKGPFDPKYTYYNNVVAGWSYLFSVDLSGEPMYVIKKTISPQTTPTNTNDPDMCRINGFGLSLRNAHEDPAVGGRVYNTGIFLMALVASGQPTLKVLPTGQLLPDYDKNKDPDTFKEIAQDVVDWLAFAMGDGVGNNPDADKSRGGFAYLAIDRNYCDYSYPNKKFPDNSNSGYAYMGLAIAAEKNTPYPGAIAFGISIPAWVRDECDYWVQQIQYTSDPLQDWYGGSSYNLGSSPNYVNLLKTGNLLFEMHFCNPNTYKPNNWRYDAAVMYIEKHWRSPLGTQPFYNLGWGYTTDHTPPINPLDVADYQTMWCLLKGFQYCYIKKINYYPPTGNKFDWFNNGILVPVTPPQQYDDFASAIVVQQHTDGYWLESNTNSDDGHILSTIWALLILERIPKIEKPCFEVEWPHEETCFLFITPVAITNVCYQELEPMEQFKITLRIDMQKGFIILGGTSTKISLIPPKNESITIKSDMIFGLGQAKITLTMVAAYCFSIATVDAVIFGPFIIIGQESKVS